MVFVVAATAVAATSVGVFFAATATVVAAAAVGVVFAATATATAFLGGCEFVPFFLAALGGR